jgi:hypothetical protein
MSFKSPSVPVLGKRSGKQNGPRFGIPGSMVALRANLHDRERRLPLRPVESAENLDFRALPVPSAAQSLPSFAFCCFPPASPAFAPR